MAVEEHTSFVYLAFILLLLLVCFGCWGLQLITPHTLGSYLAIQFCFGYEFGVSFLLFNAYLFLALSMIVSFQ